MKKSHAVGIAVTLLGAAAILMSMQIPVRNTTSDPGSRLFPMIASVALFVFGILIFLAAPKTKETDFLGRDGWQRLLLIAVELVAYLFGLKYLGFLISTPVFLFAFTTLLDREKKSRLVSRIIYSLVMTGLVWYVFKERLSVAMPAGVLF
ncbi:tripartite tricarboxylate transporter TctB family protein [Breznakiella homolactica]|uniref:Tripartite tricarboxylate transporter TctB family protein n=1 Tax=Breznakiella homolactica TaxID=2798577 RepID=A0A7T7XLT8_9SPIR|nr:tripartite tricarboxylate transporter TctB family protein [Breznakiella homolactica]QQO08666.1 tripartite tricarboxylate transporter TctB family protein [Breznakiella homolactica]